MAEQEEQQPLPVPDTPVPGSSRTGRAVALARLLHHECTRLLQLYKERETFLLDHTPDGGRMVSLSPEVGEPSAEEQVQLLHSALRQCLGLLHCVSQKEEEEWGKLEDDYETLKKNVLARLEHLLYTTKDLVETEGTTLEVTPDHRCNEESMSKINIKAVDGASTPKEVDGTGGVFGLKVWIFRVLLELIHWADHAAQTLRVLHKEREGTEEI